MDDRVTDLRQYRLRRNAEQAENRPTRAEAARNRQRTDHRLRTGVLRGRGTPPTPEYRAARAALEDARATRHQPETRNNP